MSGPVLGVAGAMQLITQKADKPVYQLAVRFTEINVRNHVNAPRGGPNLNKYGQQRSAVGEPAAVEDGNLRNLMEMPPVPTSDGKGYRVFGNYAVLEKGSMHVGPRPNAAIAVEQLRQEVNSG